MGMHDTVIEFTDDQLARLAQPHGADGVECNIWTFDALAGCGALSSTTADLLTYLEFQMHPDDGPLGPAMRLSQEAHYESPDSGLVLGLAWHMVTVSGPNALIFHDGGTNGYVSFAGFIPETQTAVVVLCNSGDALSGNAMVGALGVELLDASQAHLGVQEEDSNPQ
jgi:CubicO group peptidase (beta-lactamase class C family)